MLSRGSHLRRKSSWHHERSWVPNERRFPHLGSITHSCTIHQCIIRRISTYSCASLRSVPALSGEQGCAPLNPCSIFLILIA